MKNQIRLCSLVFLLLASIPAHPDRLTKKLEQIAESPALKGSTFSLHVIKASDGKAVFSKNSEVLLIPASNQKLLVTSAALLKLGPNFRFSTRIYAQGEVKNGTLNGNLILRGGADPNLSGRFHEDSILTPANAWVEAVRNHGITRVSGTLLVDDTIFDRIYFHPSWPKNQAHEWYEAQIGALSYNDNCLRIYVKPTIDGQLVTWAIQPDSRHMTISNSCRTVRGNRSNRIVLFRKAKQIYLRGKIGEKSRVYSTDITIDDPDLFTGSVFQKTLRAAGIKCEALKRVRERPNYDKLTLILNYPSPDLTQTIRVTNARSQNFYAEMLFKYLGYVQTRNGSFTTGAQAVLDILKKTGLDISGIVMDDGSGLSRKNRVSTGQIAELLRLMFQSDYKTEFIQSLAVPANPYGTLRKRLKGVKLDGKIHAKTGYINRVKALSGYALRADGSVLVFSFMVNRYKQKNSLKITGLQNTLMRILAGE